MLCRRGWRNAFGRWSGRACDGVAGYVWLEGLWHVRRLVVVWWGLFEGGVDGFAGACRLWSVWMCMLIGLVLFSLLLVTRSRSDLVCRSAVGCWSGGVAVSRRRAQEGARRWGAGRVFGVSFFVCACRSCVTSVYVLSLVLLPRTVFCFVHVRDVRWLLVWLLCRACHGERKWWRRCGSGACWCFRHERCIR